MAEKIIKNSLIVSLISAFCTILSYDANPSLAIGFTIITAITFFGARYIDKKYEVGVWE